MEPDRELPQALAALAQYFDAEGQAYDYAALAASERGHLAVCLQALEGVPPPVAAERHSSRNVVLDPFMISSSGKKLAQRSLPTLLKEKILPLCSIITPNIYEASVLSGLRIRTQDEMEKAAVILRTAGPETVIITGGHLEGLAMDVVYDGSFHYLKAKKRQGEYHGTGCIFSAAVTAFLAQGCSSLDAAIKAKKFMAKAFQRTTVAGSGMKLFSI